MAPRVDVAVGEQAWSMGGDAHRPDAAAGRALRRRWGIADDAFVIGCAARLDPMKDHANFLQAAAMLARQHADVRFVCVGSGPSAYRDELHALATSLGLTNHPADRLADRLTCRLTCHLTWAGEIGDMNAAYNAFDLATLSSAFGEGFPNVVGEAMACGIPVDATDVGDERPIIGVLGEVVAPKQPDLLCAGWTRLRQRLAQDPGLREAATGNPADDPVTIGNALGIQKTPERLLVLIGRHARGESHAKAFGVDQIRLGGKTHQLHPVTAEQELGGQERSVGRTHDQDVARRRHGRPPRYRVEEGGPGPSLSAR